jgi:hypothetical protein
MLMIGTRGHGRRRPSDAVVDLAKYLLAISTKAHSPLLVSEVDDEVAPLVAAGIPMSSAASALLILQVIAGMVGSHPSHTLKRSVL